MPNTVITFNVEDPRARAGFSRLQRELQQFDSEFSTAQRETRETGDAIETLSNVAKVSRTQLDELAAATERTSAQLNANRSALVAVQTQLATNANALRALAAANTVTEKTATDASKSVDNYGLALAKLRADAEATRHALNISINPQQFTAENQRFLQQFAQERIDAANAASTAEVEGFTAAAQAGKAYIEQLTRQIDAIPRVSSPDVQDGNFTSQLRKDFEETERQGRSLLQIMQEIARLQFDRLDLDVGIPDPIARGAAIDERIAEEAQGRQTLLDIQQQAGEQGRQFLNTVLRSEERDVQRSINQRARAYRQFANLVSRTFINLATGRAQNFESVATAFIQQSIRIIARAFIEHQIRKRLDDALTASKIANIQKVAAAQQAGIGLPGVGNLPGLANIGNLGGSLAGGGVALGAASLLFPEQIKNLAGGISDTIGGLLANVASVPDKAFAPQQIFLRIGDNEAREITDIQDALRQEARV